nr:hypothetical protein CFP56_62495 [Quercus suber]
MSGSTGPAPVPPERAVAQIFVLPSYASDGSPSRGFLVTIASSLIVECVFDRSFFRHIAVFRNAAIVLGQL